MDFVRWDLCDVMRCETRDYSCWDCITGGNCSNGIFIARISKFWKNVTLRAFHSWWTNRTTVIWQWWYTLKEKEHYTKSYSNSTLILRKLSFNALYNKITFTGVIALCRGRKTFGFVCWRDRRLQTRVKILMS